MSARTGDSAEEKEEEREERRNIEDEDFEEAVKEAASSAVSRRKPLEQQIILHIPEAVDDFLRNFLRKAGLSRTLSSFEAEWYVSAQRLLQETLPTAAPGTFFISDANTHRHLLQMELDSVRRDTDLFRREAMAAAESLVRMQRERDFHRLQYGCVAQQKSKLLNDYKQLKNHLQSYEPVLRQVEDKYQAALRQKTLISLQKDRLPNSTVPQVSHEQAQGKKESKAD
ncbi:sperm-associated antigen 16 protein-like [Melanotaenia boesemani]|uniref:sperm-associated antigen 16 protein-like n=1 Tax=Melanotaenia boesemani TaxID=1250792 RepID=UPI001C05A58D|nr:sperm-associated antigen 16 protein-like [Melanotaenia boesemani]